MRSCYFHPFIVLNAKLWHLAGDQLNEVNSARLFIGGIDYRNVYVDLVSELP
jgi:hypothetical protein